MTIIAKAESEERPLWRFLRDRHGIECQIVRSAERVETGSFTSAHLTVYTYIQPSTGKPLWIVETEMFSPPDVQWWRNWVVDAEPTDEHIAHILETNAEAEV